MQAIMMIQDINKALGVSQARVWFLAVIVLAEWPLANQFLSICCLLCETEMEVSTSVLFWRASEIMCIKCTAKCLAKLISSNSFIIL